MDINDMAKEAPERIYLYQLHDGTFITSERRTAPTDIEYVRACADVTVANMGAAGKPIECCWPADRDGDFSRTDHVKGEDNYCSVCGADLISREERQYLDSYFDDPLRGETRC